MGPLLGAVSSTGATTVRVAANGHESHYGTGEDQQGSWGSHSAKREQGGVFVGPLPSQAAFIAGGAHDQQISADVATRTEAFLVFLAVLTALLIPWLVKLQRALRSRRIADRRINTDEPEALHTPAKPGKNWAKAREEVLKMESVHMTKSSSRHELLGVYEPCEELEAYVV